MTTYSIHSQLPSAFGDHLSFIHNLTIRNAVVMMDLLNTDFLSLGSKYSPQHPVLNDYQSMFFP